MHRNMSADEATKKRRGAPKKRVLKIRQNMTLAPEIVKAARKLAFNEGLSLSTWIEQLVRAKVREDQIA